MTSRGLDRGRQRAEFYEARARNYRLQATLLKERDSDTDSAGALIYESAKQCINAVANLSGENPAAMGAKLNALEEISEREPDDLDLMQNWEGALRLHIHADRGFLDDSQFREAWDRAEAFVETMLWIYGRGG